MKLPKKYRNAIYFMRMCERADMNPSIMAELSILAQRAFSAGERACNIPDYNAGPARERFELLAGAAGLSVEWPGLYPECYKADGLQVQIAVNM